MKDKNNCSYYLGELHGTWKSKESDVKYGFHLIEFENKKDIYQLKVAYGKDIFINETHPYKVWSDNINYFIDFLGKTYEIIKIDNRLETPEMELKDKNGNIIKYLKSKEMIF